MNKTPFNPSSQILAVETALSMAASIHGRPLSNEEKTHFTNLAKDINFLVNHLDLGSFQAIVDKAKQTADATLSPVKQLEMQSYGRKTKRQTDRILAKIGKTTETASLEEHNQAICKASIRSAPHAKQLAQAQCAHCKKENDPVKDSAGKVVSFLKKCCGNAFYCSKECQRADWKNHKIQCVSTRKK